MPGGNVDGSNNRLPRQVARGEELRRMAGARAAVADPIDGPVEPHFLRPREDVPASNSRDTDRPL